MMFQDVRFMSIMILIQLSIKEVAKSMTSDRINWRKGIHVVKH